MKPSEDGQGGNVCAVCDVCFSGGRCERKPDPSRAAALFRFSWDDMKATPEGGHVSDLKQEVSARWAEANIEDGVIVIRVPVSVLPAALEHNPRDDSYRGSLITSLDDFARDVVRELNREEEDGTTPIHLLFDKAMAEAIEQGSMYYEFPKVKR